MTHSHCSVPKKQGIMRFTTPAQEGEPQLPHLKNFQKYMCFLGTATSYIYQLVAALQFAIYCTKFVLGQV